LPTTRAAITSVHPAASLALPINKGVCLMNPSTPTSRDGAPIIVAFENVPHVLMLGDQIAPAPAGRSVSLTFQQRIQIESRLRAAQHQNVPLVIVLWPKKPAVISGLEADREVQQ